MTFDKVPYLIIAGLLVYIFFIQELEDCPACPTLSDQIVDCSDAIDSILSHLPDTAVIEYEQSAPEADALQALAPVAPKKEDVLDPLTTYDFVVRTPTDKVVGKYPAVTPDQPLSAGIGGLNLVAGEAVTSYGIVAYEHYLRGQLLRSKYSLKPFRAIVPLPSPAPESMVERRSAIYVMGSLAVPLNQSNAPVGLNAGLMYVPGRKPLSIMGQYDFARRQVIMGLGLKLFNWK